MADENELDRLAGLRPPRPPHPTCIETTGPAEMVAGIQSWVCGPDCPRPAGPDPARDARVDAYRDRERRRAARALDRYIEIMFSPPLDEVARRVAGERFVEEVGDYVLARIGERAAVVHDPRMHVRGCSGAFGVPCIPECGTTDTESE